MIDPVEPDVEPPAEDPPKSGSQATRRVRLRSQGERPSPEDMILSNGGRRPSTDWAQCRSHDVCSLTPRSTRRAGANIRN